ncbi:hypothetical protein [Sphingomonas sp. LT1P40]|uniref:hypothetical protein n=1 Tax=Alteristakelama amylovorans TaxID=3096166 RepID=UPI002FC8FD02
MSVCSYTNSILSPGLDLDYYQHVFERKLWAIAMSTPSAIDGEDYGPAIDMAAFGCDLARRRAAIEAETGEPFTVARNNGTRRTESKKALLAEINKLAAAKGFRW